MKRFICMLFVALLCSTSSMAQNRCKKCHGRGIIKTHTGMSVSGTSNDRKNHCSICGQFYWVSQDHWDKCNACPTPGPTPPEPEICAYLDLGECELYNDLLKMRMIGTKKVNANCTLCNGSGLCNMCKGSGYIYMMNRYIQCTACYGAVQCGQCGGAKVTTQTVRLNKNDIANIDKKLKYYQQKARKNGWQQ